MNGIRRILVQVEAAGQPNRIGRYESSAVRIVVSPAVVVQPGFRIMLLPLKPCAYRSGYPFAIAVSGAIDARSDLLVNHPHECLLLWLREEHV